LVCGFWVFPPFPFFPFPNPNPPPILWAFFLFSWTFEAKRLYTHFCPVDPRPVKTPPFRLVGCFHFSPVGIVPRNRMILCRPWSRQFPPLLFFCPSSNFPQSFFFDKSSFFFARPPRPSLICGTSSSFVFPVSPLGPLFNCLSPFSQCSTLFFAPQPVFFFPLETAFFCPGPSFFFFRRLHVQAIHRFHLHFFP